MRTTHRYTLLWLFALILLLGGCSDSPRLQPLAANDVILAFGDSLTYGTGSSAEESYPAVLEKISGHTVINAGIPGERTLDGLNRLSSVLDRHQPALMILCLGGNDMLRKVSIESMESNLESMVGLAQERGIQVVLLGVPRPALFGLESAESYYRLAEKTGTPLEDTIIPEVLSDTNLKSDQIHPNAAGYQMMAEAVYRLLREKGAL